MAVEGVVVHPSRLVEDREHDDAGGALAVGPVARRCVLVAAVVLVERLGDEVARAPDACFGEDRLVLGVRIVVVDPHTHRGAHRQFVVGDGHHRGDLRVRVVEMHLEPARARREEARREVVEELPADVLRIARRTVPDQIDELLHGPNPIRRAAP